MRAQGDVGDDGEGPPGRSARQRPLTKAGAPPAAGGASIGIVGRANSTALLSSPAPVALTRRPGRTRKPTYAVTSGKLFYGGLREAPAGD
jgi:hypothetical protein